MDACQVCASHAWAMLPNPHPTQSVTTAGVIVNQPLSKGVCLNCGFTQRDSIEWMAFSQYYENQYENYYNRPGTERYHQARYTAIVDWMSDFIQPQHQKVLDVGCGQGWAMQTFKSKFPNATLHGLEPSHYNSKYARQLGFEVFEGRLADYCDQIETYDLIFSNNVIQHVDDARAFLRQLKTLLKPEGRLIVTCPNGARPNIEMLWADQNYSFIASHLIALARQEGYSILSCQESSSSNALPPALMMVLSLKRK
ncbi:MAG: class I SAM-dependent methyltransferase, partial [Gammaproteobacteria bacterium]|nr:class I SAM-dependent methyltransferase [Gammaproteobacteria bacterium]